MSCRYWLKLLISLSMVFSIIVSAKDCGTYIANVILKSSQWTRAKNPAYSMLYQSIINCRFLPCKINASGPGIIVTGTLREIEDSHTLQVDILNLHTYDEKAKDSSHQKKAPLNKKLTNTLSALFDGIKTFLKDNEDFKEVELLANTTKSQEMKRFLRRIGFFESSESHFLTLWGYAASGVGALLSMAGIVDSIIQGNISPFLVATPLIFSYKLDTYFDKDFVLRIDA